jgi:hypothetical protein
MKALSAKLLLMFAAFICVALESHALNPVPDLPSKPSSPKAVPIDGGVSLLIAAGIGLGAGKYFMNQKEKTD